MVIAWTPSDSVSILIKEDIELSVFVVSIICAPLQRQSFTEARLICTHLKGLRLADYGCIEDNA